MGCPRLTYREKEERLNFLGLWKKSDGSEKCDDYYPFGLTFNEYQRENYLLNKYQYNGKELQSDLSLDWYDYGARMYMPETGRWGAQDTKAEKYSQFSPYNYCLNNPIKFLDPDGKDVLISYSAEIEGKTVTQTVKYSGGQLFKADGSEYKGSNAYLRTVQSQLNDIKKLDEDVKGMVEDLESSDLTHTITNVSKIADINGSKTADKNEANDEIKEVKTEHGSELATGSITTFNAYAPTTNEGESHSAKSTLAHELKHAHNKDRAQTKSGRTSNGIKNEEIDAVNTENKINQKLDLPNRTTYGGREIPKDKLQ